MGHFGRLLVSGESFSPLLTAYRPSDRLRAPLFLSLVSIEVHKIGPKREFSAAIKKESLANLSCE